MKAPRNGRCLDKRDVWQRLHDADRTKRGTTLSRKDVQAILERLEQAQAAPAAADVTAAAARAMADEEVW